MKKIICSTIAISLMLIGSALAADLNKDDAATIAKDGMGIGIKKAEMIVNERTARGPYKDWNDLKLRIKGFGPATMEKNKTSLTFGASPAVLPVATAPVAAPLPVATPVAPVAAPLPVATPVAPVAAPLPVAR